MSSYVIGGRRSSGLGPSHYIIGVLVILMFLAMGVFTFMNAWHLEQVTLNVTGKERITTMKSDSDGNINSKIRNFVYTDEDTYVVADSFLNWHFRAGTVYAKIPEAGGTCKATTSGYRMGFLSLYKNIIEVECEPKS